MMFTKRQFGRALVSAVVVIAGCASPAERAYYPYHRPLVSPGTAFGGLPPAVQQTIRAQTGTAEMRDVLKFTASGRVVYEVLFTNPELFPPLYLATDGSVLYPSLTVAVAAGQERIGALSGGRVSGVKIEDLPINVLNTIHEKAPTSEISYVHKTGAGSKTLYEVIFKDAQAPRLYVHEDGALANGAAEPAPTQTR